MIKAVIFDIDGVLLDSFEANLIFYQNLFTKFGYGAPSREEFPKYFHRAMWDVIKAITRLEDDVEIKKLWDAGKGRDIPYPTELLTMPEGSHEVLEELSKKYLLGIVTSRVRTSVFEAPQLKKLKHLFKTAVAYEDTKEHKPDPEPLLLAAKNLNVLPRECVYVGDVENDLIAGHAAGMKVIIYSKNSVEKADAQTTSFKELPRLIHNL